MIIEIELKTELIEPIIISVISVILIVNNKSLFLKTRREEIIKTKKAFYKVHPLG